MGTTLVKTKSGSELVDLTIADLTKIGEIGVESDEIDVTSLDSPDDFKEFIAGAKDAGEVSLEGFIKSENNVDAMYSLALARTVEAWTITAPNGSVWTFNALVKSFKEGEATVDGARAFTATLRVSGAPTYTPVSA
jgi:predicted secreted protein